MMKKGLEKAKEVKKEEVRHLGNGTY